MKHLIFLALVIGMLTACSDMDQVSPVAQQDELSAATENSTSYDFIHYVSDDETVIYQYDKNIGKVVNTYIEIDGVRISSRSQDDGNGGSNEKKDFSGDLHSKEENSTGGYNVICIKSPNHCYTSGRPDAEPDEETEDEGN